MMVNTNGYLVGLNIVKSNLMWFSKELASFHGSYFIGNFLLVDDVGDIYNV